MMPIALFIHPLAKGQYHSADKPLLPTECQVACPGFTRLVLRRTPLEWQGTVLQRVVTIVVAEPRVCGEGIFSLLLLYLRSKGLSVVVENVPEGRFASHLRKDGFQHLGKPINQRYVWLYGSPAAGRKKTAPAEA